MIAAIIGIVMVVSIRPGVNTSRDAAIQKGEEKEVSTLDAILDLIR